MKKYILSLVLLFTVFSLNVYAQAKDVTVKVNNIVVESPVAAQIINDRTMLPMRSIFERVGANVSWIEEERIIIATKGKKLITMQIDNPLMSVQSITNDEIVKIELDSPPIIKDDSTIVPVRAVAESLGYPVEWDAQTYTVNISTISNEVN
mgnify:CR=1 FL=1